MKERFKNIFATSTKIIDWLESPGVFGMMKARNILFFMFILFGVIFYYLENFSDSLNKFLVGLLMITVFALLFVLSLKYYWIKPPKFIRKDTVNPAQLFDRFSHWSFLYGILIYSLFASFFMVGIYIALIKFILSINYDFSNLFFNVFFITAAIFLILYFMYHITIKELSTKVIKARIRLYLAIIATLMAGLFGLSLKEILLPLITYLGIGLAWLSFLIEKIESEIEDLK